VTAGNITVTAGSQAKLDIADRRSR